MLHSLDAEQERRIGKRDDRSWESYFSFGMNEKGFEVSLNYPDLSVVGTLRSSNSWGTVTLVAPNYLITAAHLIKNDLSDNPVPSNWEFVLHAKPDDATDKDRYSIVEFIIHPSWTARQTVSDTEGDGDEIGVDLALARLNRSVDGTFPVRLPQSDDDPLGKRTVLSGYGTLVEGGNGDTDTETIRRTGAENVIDRSVSKVSKTGVPTNETGGLLGIDFDSPGETDNNLSANHTIIDFLGDGNSSPTPLPMEASTAVGDSGGPALVYSNKFWRIHGVVSYGISDSTYGDVTIYTRLASHYDWLTEQLPTWSDSMIYSGSTNWMENPWLGTIYTTTSKWCLSLDLGWLYIPSAKGNFFWAWSELIEKWIWLSDQCFPSVVYYSEKNPDASWLFIDLNASTHNSIRFYDHSSMVWQTVPSISD